METNTKVKPIKSAITDHPCFDPESAKRYARMHVPVAPKCNIQCNYCNRKYDCANESRPGVTAKVMQPDEAVESVAKMKKLMPHLTTIGIAGPGDSLANPDKTFRVMDKISKKYPSMNLCISTNGLMLPEYVDEIRKYNISHVTVTINAINKEIARKIYKWVNYDHTIYRGDEAAQILLERQYIGLEKLYRRNIMAKVNFIYIPGVNEKEYIHVFRKTRELGADLFNIMPFIPVEKTAFANLEAPGEDEMELAKAGVRSENGGTGLMDHCRQCRSDACGLLDEDQGVKARDEIA